MLGTKIYARYKNLSCLIIKNSTIEHLYLYMKTDDWKKMQTCNRFFLVHTVFKLKEELRLNKHLDKVPVSDLCPFYLNIHFLTTCKVM